MSKRYKIISITIILLIITHILLVRPYYMHWGTTEQEDSMSLPGDSLMDKNAVISTRAITIHAPSRKVWKWIVQLGQGRGRYYTYYWLENLFTAQMINADTIVPELQNIKIGDSVYFHRRMPPARIAIIDWDKTLVLTGG